MNNRNRITTMAALAACAMAVSLVPHNAIAQVRRNEVHRLSRDNPTATVQNRVQTRRVVNPQRTVVQPATPPLPIVALQLTGLTVRTSANPSAVMHALARDAWPRLVRCVQPPPGVRGYAHVSLTQPPSDDRRATVQVEATGTPMTRSSTLHQCVTTALSRVVLPPHEGTPIEGPSVTFDLAFAMPSILQRQIRAQQRQNTTVTPAAQQRPARVITRPNNNRER